MNIATPPTSNAPHTPAPGVSAATLILSLLLSQAVGVCATIAIIVSVFYLGPPASGGGRGEDFRPAPVAAELAGGQPGSPGKTSVPSRLLLEKYDALTPADRWQRIETIAGVKDYEAAVRGDLVQTVVARGSLESAKPNYVVCTVRAAQGAAAGVIKWVVEDGTFVKKGDLLIQLDDAGLRDQLKDQQTVLDKARADFVRTKDDFDLVGMDNEANILTSEIDIRTAEVLLKKYRGEDVEEAAILKLQVDRAKLNIARAKALARSRLAHAQAALDAKKAVIEAEQTRVHDVEQQIQACKMVAPQDGIAVYFVPEPARGGGQQAIVAQGEPVREGQKLMMVPDLTQMLVSIRVPEAFVSGLRGEDRKDKNGPQAARIRIDAFPKRVLQGHVKAVDNTPLHPDFFAKDVKNYRALVSIDDKLEGLKPGMSGEVTIDTGRAAGALHVPLKAVVRVGPQQFCYVKRGKEIQKAAVTTGLATDTRVEIRSGLQEGDEVLRDPVGLLSRLK